MAYTLITGKPGVAAVTPTNGTKVVFYFTVATTGKIRIQADTAAGGAAPIHLELHLYRYPATSFSAKDTFFEATMPTGTHYIAASSSPGGVHFTIWKARPTACPAGCVAAPHMVQAIRQAAARIHEQAGLPPPTLEQLRPLVPEPLRHLLELPPPQRRPAVPPPAARLAAAARRAAAKKPPPPPPTVTIMADGPAARVALSAKAPVVRLRTTIKAAGNYEWTVTPPPLAEQELYYLSLANNRGQVVQSSSDGHLLATMAAQVWTASLSVPKSLLASPKTLRVQLSKKDPPPVRPGLDNPPDGDGQLRVGAAVPVDIRDTRPKAQLAVDIATAASYRFTCTEVTGGSSGAVQADAPAILTLYDAAGVRQAGPAVIGTPLTAALTVGRWWVDVEVPDFHGRTTPRRYAVAVARTGAT